MSCSQLRTKKTCFQGNKVSKTQITQYFLMWNFIVKFTHVGDLILQIEYKKGGTFLLTI